jgi:hypothetical protein
MTKVRSASALSGGRVSTLEGKLLIVCTLAVVTELGTGTKAFAEVLGITNLSSTSVH